MAYIPMSEFMDKYLEPEKEKPMGVSITDFMKKMKTPPEEVEVVEPEKKELTISNEVAKEKLQERGFSFTERQDLRPEPPPPKAVNVPRVTHRSTGLIPTFDEAYEYLTTRMDLGDESQFLISLYKQAAHRYRLSEAQLRSCGKAMHEEPITLFKQKQELYRRFDDLRLELNAIILGEEDGGSDANNATEALNLIESYKKPGKYCGSMTNKQFRYLCALLRKLSL